MAVDARRSLAACLLLHHTSKAPGYWYTTHSFCLSTPTHSFACAYKLLTLNKARAQSVEKWCGKPCFLEEQEHAGSPAFDTKWIAQMWVSCWLRLGSQACWWVCEAGGSEVQEV